MHERFENDYMINNDYMVRRSVHVDWILLPFVNNVSWIRLDYFIFT